MEKTLILIKPNAIQRGLTGDIITRFERKGLRFVGVKMMFMTDEIVNEHYAHLKERPFFPYLKASMQAGPIIACCLEGAEAVTDDIVDPELIHRGVGVVVHRPAEALGFPFLTGYGVIVRVIELARFQEQVGLM